MILPNTLSPLPVSPSGDSPEASAPFEDFVAARDVRKVILGTGEFPLEGLPADDFDCFAGRADIPIPLPKRAAKWKPKPREDKVEVPVADMALETPVVHPAFEVIPPARRAAPPQLLQRERSDCEASYGNKRQGRISERWWVIGMGLAASALLFSGALVDFIGREAMRRSHVEAATPPPAPASPRGARTNPVAPAAAQGREEKEKTLPLASKVEREED